MKQVPNAIRTEAPTIIDIAKGIFKIPHIQQFFIVIMSFSFICTILRFMSFKKFLLVFIVCSTFILIFYIIGKICARRAKHKIDLNADQYMLVDSTLQWNLPSFANPPNYEVTKFFSKDFPGESNICGICSEPIREGSDIVMLTCFHYFHPDCAQKWIKIRRFCPICKTPIAQFSSFFHLLHSIVLIANFYFNIEVIFIDFHGIFFFLDYYYLFSC